MSAQPHPPTILSAEPVAIAPVIENAEKESEIPREANTVSLDQEIGFLTPGDRLRNRRARWRQRLIDVERGLTFSFRGDSILFAHLFVGIVILMMGFVLGLSRMQWVAIVFGFGAVLSSELFRQAIREINFARTEPGEKPRQTVHQLASTAAFLVLASCSIGTGLIFADRLWVLLSK